MQSGARACRSVVTGLNPTAVNPANPFPLFVIQAVVIVGLCYILHFGLRKLKQPRVISEVIAGIILGPSVMGRIPGFADTIFPPDGLPYLNLVSNIGLVMFLFLVGLELDPALVMKRAKFALGITFAGMVLPLGVGAAVSYVLYSELGPDTTVGFGQFLLFCGVAMSITAFPVLARILAEQKLLTTKVGFLTVCAGAVGDIFAWILLALVVSIINSASKITPLYVVLLSIAWILILCFVFRPLFTFMIRVTKSHDEPSQTMMAFTLAIVLISAFVTDIIGVHAIFGSFLVGLIIPNDTGFADGVTKRIEDLVSVIFLPIYFALSGLKTQVGLLDNARIWGLVILVTFVACFGKIVGCTLAAKVQGMEWRESFAVGILMNCKGLIELIVLNIGYDAGVINDKVFVIMVAMCLITTCMTTPGVVWVYPAHYQRASAARALAKERKKNGDLEHSQSSEAMKIGANKGFMLCLDKIHNLPAMMTFLEMLHHAVPNSAPEEKSYPPEGTGDAVVQSSLSIMSAPKLIALRLMHLTDRSSSVLLAATEGVEVLRRDTLMTVFQAFAKLNGIIVGPRMTLAMDPADFAHSICDEAIESGTGVIIVPWNSSSLPDPPMNNTDDSQNPVLSRPLVTSNTQMVSRLLNTTAHTGLVTAIFVDREFGGAGHFLNIMVPLYGSVDDEEALKVASAMSHNSLCNILIVRIESTMKTGKADNNEDTHVHMDDHSITSSMEDISALPENNQVLVQVYFSHRAFSPNDRRANNKRTTAAGTVEVGMGIFVHQVPTIHDAIGLSKAVLGPRDLLVMGRGHTSKAGRHSAAASTYMTEPAHVPLSHQGTSAASQGRTNTPGLHLQNMPTGISVSVGGTPTQPIDNPLGGVHDHHAMSGGGLRPRHQLRTQPSSRDLHHSHMTVATILGVAAQSYLASELASCLLVVQSGTRSVHDDSAGVEFSRVSSVAVPSSTLQLPPQMYDPVVMGSDNRPQGFENEQTPIPYSHLNEEEKRG
ncbi:K(+)/H(+) antiporter [Mortierella polycephala]|uniref:K(+)/H(+) antiporter n=1 Tax=Mortierella polycephala TaxID=41804 RepID=A0A9P6Q807_9FUNG|nr:K(+)/H(+) antiporter [Mortierella polycephala]